MGGLNSDFFFNFGKTLKLVSGALSDDLALIKNDNTITKNFNLFHIVGGVDDGGALITKLLDTVENIITTLRINGNSGFIEEDKFGLMSNAAGNIETTKKAAGKLFRIKFTIIFQTDELEGGVNVLLADDFVSDVKSTEVIEVLIDGELIKNSNFLKDYTDLTLEIVGIGLHGATKDFNFTGLII